MTVSRSSRVPLCGTYLTRLSVERLGAGVRESLPPFLSLLPPYTVLCGLLV